MDTVLVGKKFKQLFALNTFRKLTIFLLSFLAFHVFANPFQALSLSQLNRIENWENLIKKAQPQSDIDILTAVNHFINQLDFVADTPLMGSDDYWYTPYEFLIQGGGDCEDFAIAKFFTAKSLGISKNKLRITYVTIKNRNQAHMILTYYPKPGAEPLILDNINQKILKASERPDLKPVYSFSVDEVWLQQSMNKSRHYGDANSLSKWRALLKRFEEQRRLRNMP
tara:strand:- start:342 stop:1016 length:675 start_codon:yes stop_codon:yes gene_type:complete